MKKLLSLAGLALALIILVSACKEKTVTVQRTLNGTVWKKFEVRKGDRDVFKILTFKAPDIVNISVRDDHGYVFAEFQKEYVYLYEHPRFVIFGTDNVPDEGRLMNETTIELNREIFLKVK